MSLAGMTTLEVGRRYSIEQAFQFSDAEDGVPVGLLVEHRVFRSPATVVWVYDDMAGVEDHAGHREAILLDTIIAAEPYDPVVPFRNPRHRILPDPATRIGDPSDVH